MKTLTVTIDENGELMVEANGFKGKACERAIEKLLSAVGTGSRKVVKVKPEYHQQEETHRVTLRK